MNQKEMIKVSGIQFHPNDVMAITGRDMSPVNHLRLSASSNKSKSISQKMRNSVFRKP